MVTEDLVKYSNESLESYIYDLLKTVIDINYINLEQADKISKKILILSKDLLECTLKRIKKYLQITLDISEKEECYEKCANVYYVLETLNKSYYYHYL